jgi:hypothetical protein
MTLTCFFREICNWSKNLISNFTIEVMSHLFVNKRRNITHQKTSLLVLSTKFKFKKKKAFFKNYNIGTILRNTEFLNYFSECATFF